MDYELKEYDVFKAWDEKDQKVFYNLEKKYANWSFDLKKALDEGLDSVTFKRLNSLKSAVDTAVAICNAQS